ncbi:MAG: glycosyltransferase [Limnohabitans sp.]|nr:glycosyltransferase [Limnohabitans sp.]
MLAIVIPFYKISFIEETFQSLANQTNKNFKVYIGDDASPEDVSVILAKYRGFFDFNYFRFSENLGGKSLVQQWERCIELVKDEKWLMILGDDDVLDENCVELFYNNLSEIEEGNINVVRYSTVVIDKSRNEISKIHIHPKFELSIDFLMRKFQGGTRSSLSEYIFKLEDLKRIKFKDIPLAWYSDLLAVLEVSNFSTIFTINDAKVYFRWSGENITSKTDNMVLKNIGTFQFYYYLVNNCSQFISQYQESRILDHLEKTFLDNKRNKTFWKNFTKLYFKRGLFSRYGKFIIKVIKSVIK